MALIYPAQYLGLPRDQIPALETVAQATVSRLYELCRTLLQMEEESRIFGDVDYTITRGSNGLLLLVDHSSGWWAIMQISRPYQSTTFQVFARSLTSVEMRLQSDITVRGPAMLVEHFQQGKADWRQMQNFCLEGKSDLYLGVSRDFEDPNGSWYGPYNQINYTHPLLYHLTNAIAEIEGVHG